MFCFELCYLTSSLARNQLPTRAEQPLQPIRAWEWSGYAYLIHLYSKACLNQINYFLCCDKVTLDYLRHWFCIPLCFHPSFLCPFVIRRKSTRRPTTSQSAALLSHKPLLSCALSPRRPQRPKFRPANKSPVSFLKADKATAEQNQIYCRCFESSELCCRRVLE